MEIAQRQAGSIKEKILIVWEETHLPQLHEIQAVQIIWITRAEIQVKKQNPLETEIQTQLSEQTSPDHSQTLDHVTRGPENV